MKVLLVVLAVVAAIVAAVILFNGSKTADPRPSLKDESLDASASGPASPRATSRPRPAPAEGFPLEIEVVLPGGKPAGGSRVILYTETALHGSEVTDERGIAGFLAGDGDAGILILPAGAPNFVGKTSLERGRRRIQLPPGASVSGRVLVGGVPPGEAIALSAWSQEVEDLPLTYAVWTALKGDTSPKCVTTVSGAFELEGLREGSEWNFSAPLGYRLDELMVDGREVSAVKAPASGVALKLSRVPIIRGRLVVAGTHTPIPRAACTASLIGDISSQGLHFDTGDDGTFRFTVQSADRNESIVRIDFTVRPTQQHGGKTVVLDPAPKKDLDLDNVEVAGGRKIRFIVRDPAGSPIAGAWARTSDEVDPGSRTDATGLGAIEVAAGVESFFVGALRYDVAEVKIPEAVPDPMPVVLQAGAGLEVTVTAPPGSKSDWFRVRLSAAKRDVFVNGTMGNDATLVAGGANANAFGAWSAASAQVDFKPDAKGRVVIAGLKPKIQLRLEVLDELENTLASGSETLDPGQWKSVELTVTQVARSLRGRVRDAAGRPVQGATAAVDADPATFARGQCSQRRINASTDAEGTFLLSGIFVNPVHFAVDKDGFVPWIRRGLRLPDDDAAMDVTLLRGCQVTVEVVDSDGNPIKDRDLRVSATVPDQPTVSGRPKQPGTFLLADVPLGATATIITAWAGREWTQSMIASADHTERVTMPPMGKVVVDWSAVGDVPVRVELRPADPSASTIARYIARRRDQPVPDHDEVYPVPPGRYTATATDRRGNSVAMPETIDVRPSETLRVVFRKP